MAMLSERDRYHNYFFCKCPIDRKELYAKFQRVLIDAIQRPNLGFIEVYVATKICLT
jgi:hypothetical protein